MMQPWPRGDDEDLPSPEPVAALLALDQLRAERVPWWAAAWLADGRGGRATAELAGLDGRDMREVRDLLPDVFGELNVPVPGSAAAAATVAFAHLARLCLHGLAGEYRVVQKVEEIFTQNVSCWIDRNPVAWVPGVRDPAGMTLGMVKFFKPDKGYGAITSPELPAGFDAWVHFSAIEMDGYRCLEPGDQVEFDYEAAQQDSFRFVATRVRKL
jgi:cold shock protein